MEQDVNDVEQIFSNNNGPGKSDRGWLFSSDYVHSYSDRKRWKKEKAKSN